MDPTFPYCIAWPLTLLYSTHLHSSFEIQFCMQRFYLVALLCGVGCIYGVRMPFDLKFKFRSQSTSFTYSVRLFLHNCFIIFIPFLVFSYRAFPVLIDDMSKGRCEDVFLVKVLSIKSLLLL